MSNVTIKIWGRDFKLDVVFDCYDGEEITTLQNETLDSFLDNTSIVDDMKSSVDMYLVNNNKEDFPDGKVDNIFKYVIPTSIFIKRTKKNKVAAIMCNYKFDIEHGLAIVYENNQFINIVPQDNIL